MNSFIEVKRIVILFFTADIETISLTGKGSPHSYHA